MEEKEFKHVYERNKMKAIQEALMSIGCPKQEAAEVAWNRFRYCELPADSIVETYKTLINMGLSKDEALTNIRSRLSTAN